MIKTGDVTSNNSSGVYLYKGTNDEISTGNISAPSSIGINLGNVSDSKITAGDISESSRALELYQSTGNEVTVKDITQTGSLSFGGVYIFGASSGNTITAGNIKTDTDAVSLWNNDTKDNTITVGNITTSDDGVIIMNNADGNKVTSGSITAKENGIYINSASDNAVTVTGDVIITGAAGSIVDYYGNHYDPTAIKIESSTGSKVAVEGTVNAGEGNGIYVDSASADSTTITLFEITANDEGKLVTSDKAETADIVKAAINYIIKSEVTGSTGDTVSLTKLSDSDSGKVGSYTASDNTTYLTATTGSYLVACSSSYSISNVAATGKAEISKNADGSYSITVRDGGGVKMTITLDIPVDPTPVDPVVPTDPVVPVVPTKPASPVIRYTGSSDGGDSGESTALHVINDYLIRNAAALLPENQTSGWVLVNNNWHYLDNANSMVTGWIQDPMDGHWYYIDPATGIMQTGWKQINDKWYYFSESTAGGWTNTTGRWTYNGSGNYSLGSMYANEYTPDGYYVDATGAWDR